MCMNASATFLTQHQRRPYSGPTCTALKNTRSKAENFQVTQMKNCINFHSLFVEAFPNNCQKDLDENMWWDESKAAARSSCNAQWGKFAPPSDSATRNLLPKHPFSIFWKSYKIAKSVHKTSFLNILETWQNFAKSVHKTPFLNILEICQKSCKICSQNGISPYFGNPTQFREICS